MRVLIATDGSEHAERAVRLIGGMAWPAGTAFRIVEVVSELADITGALLAEGSPAISPPGTSDALLRAAALLRGDDDLVDLVVRQGRAADRILAEAAAFNADAIAVGHRGRGQVASTLLGSVAAEVAQRSSVPVLVARGERIGEIVVGDDGSEPARAARSAIATWPGLRSSHVTVVSAAQVLAPLATGIAPTMRRAAAAAKAEEVAGALAEHDAIAGEGAAELRSRGVRAAAIAVMGDPATAILEVGERAGASLIVVGTRGRGGFQGLLGSVARAVVLRAKCSVLVVPA